jgi:hypothetical protein
MSPVSVAARPPARVPSRSSITAARVRRLCGCTWGPSAPRRVVIADDTHTPPAPYQLVNNDYNLLDASDLVFIDATDNVKK